MYEADKKNEVLGRLYAFLRIINECIGDGIADMLAVEQLLRFNDWSIALWECNTYKNAHNAQIKVLVFTNHPILLIYLGRKSRFVRDSRRLRNYYCQA